MLYKKIVLAGGNGYLGTVLANHFSSIAEEVIILARKPKPKTGNIDTLVWDGKTLSTWASALSEADLLVNLCGKNVNCRYTEANQEEIFRSRLVPTRLLAEAINRLDFPPKLWINMSSATIYRHAEDCAQDEFTGEIGDGFSIEVCKAWEKVFFDSETPITRKVALRMGVVLGRKDGAFPRLLTLVKLGMGGKQGDGQQYVNWVHERDAIASVEWLLKNPEIKGVVNCTSPNAVKNETLMASIRSAYGMPFGLPVPALLLALAARIIGTETELVLKSRWIKPAVLLANGFSFKYAEIDSAVKHILNQRD